MHLLKPILQKKLFVITAMISLTCLFTACFHLQDKARAPSKSKVEYYKQGRKLLANGASDMQLIKHYEECLRYYPEDEFCRVEHRKFQLQSQSPSCETPHIANLNFYEAYPLAQPGWIEIKDHDQIFYRKVEPALTAQDIMKVRFMQAHKAGQPPYVEGAFRPEGTKRFAAITKQLAAKNGYLAIMVGQKVISVPKVQLEIESGNFYLLASDFSFDEICKN